jgi:hypothetical protein
MTPHQSRPNDGLAPTVSRLFIATLIPVFGLFILRVILGALPMIRNAGPIGDLGITPFLLIKAVLDTVIYFLVITFCFATSREIRNMQPHLTEIASIVLLAGCALVATLAYSGYEVLFAVLAPSQSDSYNWIFLAIVLAPIGMIVVIVTRRLDFFTNLMVGKLNQVAMQPQAFSAAAGSSGPESTPSPQPPPGPAPELDPMKEVRGRLDAVERKVASARVEAERLRARNALTSQAADSASKMQSYMEGAVASIDQRDWAGARHFADWAEYEATCVLATGK